MPEPTLTDEEITAKISEAVMLLGRMAEMLVPDHAIRIVALLGAAIADNAYMIPQEEEAETKKKVLAAVETFWLKALEANAHVRELQNARET